MIDKRSNRWSIVGYMGAGKTYLGKELEKRTGLEFIDLDDEISERYGASISEICQRKGELAFRRMEREVLLDILDQDDLILSTGGGTPCYYDNMDVLKSKSHTIYLDLSIPLLVKRLEGERKVRPLLPPEGDLTEFVAKHLFERRPFYLRSDVVFRPEKMDISELTKIIRP